MRDEPLLSPGRLGKALVSWVWWAIHGLGFPFWYYLVFSYRPTADDVYKATHQVDIWRLED